MHLIAQWMYFQASLMGMFRIKNSKTTWIGLGMEQHNMYAMPSNNM